MIKHGSDKVILVIVLLLMSLGLVFVYSSSFPVAELRFHGANFFVKRQFIRALIALVAMFGISRLDYHYLAKISPLLYLVSIGLLFVVLLMPTINGSRRWIRIGPMLIQVSEVARTSLILILSYRLSEFNKEDFYDRRKLLKVLSYIGVIAGLVVFEPDFSTAMLISIAGLSIIWVAQVPKRIMIAILIVGLIGGLVVGLRKGYRLKRLTGFLHSSENASGSAYQQTQGLIAIGHGGLFGVGLGAGEQKYFFLPEAHTDFMFSIMSEETGFAGMTVVLLAYLILIYRGYSIAQRSPDLIGKYIASGITTVIALYVILHVLVNLKMFPVTGVPLPFLSYGGMSLIFTSFSIGILLNISKYTTEEVGK